MKKSFCFMTLLVLTFCMAQTSGREASFSGSDYDIQLFYNDTACPGDAVFVRLNFIQSSRQKKNTEYDIAETKSTLMLCQGKKELRKSSFYAVPVADNSKKKIYTASFLTGIPLSSWWKETDSFTLKIVYTLGRAGTFDFELPLTIAHKEFVSETIPLDDRNTGIKTNASDERMQQINRLNKILETVNPQSVYQTSSFVPPTTATRRTSFFADRRVYAYSNGKSSTSLHYGTDYGVPTGTDVTACAKGKVVMAENRISTGWSIAIEHLPGLYSLYYHMSELKVKTGDIVDEGTLIGLSGATGLATGPHLHWEIRLNMEAVNPDFFTTDFTSSLEKSKTVSR